MILILQSAGKHTENFDFRESLCFARAFQRLGLEAEVCGPGYMNFDRLDTLLSKCDIILCMENYSQVPWVHLENVNKFKVFWSIDSHIGGVLDRHLRFANENKFNIVLNSTRRFVSKFGAPGRMTKWMPNAYPSDLIDKPRGVPKEHDLGFCGSRLNRGKWLDNLTQAVSLHTDVFVLGEAMVRAIASYRIHWNRAHSVDINYRCFETMGCGTFLLTNEVEAIYDVFDRTFLETYQTFEECVEKIRYFLTHEKEREEMANSAYLHVRENHTYDQRAKWLQSEVFK